MTKVLKGYDRLSVGNPEQRSGVRGQRSSPKRDRIPFDRDTGFVGGKNRGFVQQCSIRDRGTFPRE